MKKKHGKPHPRHSARELLLHSCNNFALMRHCMDHNRSKCRRNNDPDWATFVTVVHRCQLSQSLISYCGIDQYINNESIVILYQTALDNAAKLLTNENVLCKVAWTTQ